MQSVETFVKTSSSTAWFHRLASASSSWRCSFLDSLPCNSKIKAEAFPTCLIWWLYFFHVDWLRRQSDRRHLCTWSSADESSVCESAGRTLRFAAPRATPSAGHAWFCADPFISSRHETMHPSHQHNFISSLTTLHCCYLDNRPAILDALRYSAAWAS